MGACRGEKKTGVPLTWIMFVMLQAPCFLFSESNSPEVDFRSEVLPILSENCFHCHGPDSADRKAGLRLDTVEGAHQILESGEIAVVGSHPEKSALIDRVSTPDPDERMPPPETGKSLTSTEIETLRRWISSGGHYEEHWAFLPIRPQSPPGNTDPTGSEIDRFLVAALAERGLAFSPPASRSRLIRRASFDLVGLPPKWSEVEAFVEDPAPTQEAFARVVDRLLASPAYGERWGRHWLDLARYADTHGASAIGFTRFAFSYTYRDYVIKAFNEDKPYDRFLLEQIAADQLSLEENDPSLAALGFLTIGRQFRNRHDVLDDQIDVITRGLLGLTVSCARCHDHKFDPIPTADYYALHATLANSEMPANLPFVGDVDIPEAYASEFAKRKRLRDDIVHEQGEVFRGRLRMQVGLYLAELAKGVPEQDTSTSFLSYRTEDLRPVILERWRTYLKQLEASDPVFGPWHQLATLNPDSYLEDCEALIAKLEKENGDPKKFEEEHRFATKAPKWNPRILEAIRKRKPASFVEVAEAYGEVFGEVHRDWLRSLLDASAEAAPGGELVPDQDARHRIVNSAIERQLRHHLYAPTSPTSLSFENPKDLMMLNRGVRDPVRGTLGAIDGLNRGNTAPPRSMILRESTSPPKESFVFLRGNPVARGERVEPAFLSALSPDGPVRFRDGSRRLDLAKAIVDPGNPLTRRVVVNWIWQHHFESGLVRTPDDFGTRGAPPTHPELLDYLAESFHEDGWSMKKMHRRIMLSKAYQQDSTERPAARNKDPDNNLLWRMPKRKLKLESMRDALLAASGELREEGGGRPFEETDEKATPQRSIYAFINRDVISDMAATFDGADPSACTVKRPETMVPQQTLFALNSDFIQDRARALVELPEIKGASDDRDRIHRIYHRVYGRSPDQEELEVALAYLSDSPDPAGALPQFVHALFAANEFHFID